MQYWSCHIQNKSVLLQMNKLIKMRHSHQKWPLYFLLPPTHKSLSDKHSNIYDHQLKWFKHFS